jgi:hypothetical protein
MVQRVEIEVGQQRADHRALRRTDRRNPPSIFLLDRLLQERLDQIEGASVGDPTLHQGHQGRGRDRVEIRLEVHVRDPDEALPQQGVDALQCHLRRALLAKAVAMEAPQNKRLATTNITAGISGSSLLKSGR